MREGDEIAGFKVVECPGHAPGLIGLFREEDRLALVSDCIYTLDPQTGNKGAPRVPHPAFDLDLDQARAAIRKLAALDPSVVWAGHAKPVVGDVASGSSAPRRRGSDARSHTAWVGATGSVNERAHRAAISSALRPRSTSMAKATR